MDEPSLSDADARGLRFLKVLVTVLTATMILGMAVLVVLFATRFPDPRADRAPAALLPDTLRLPADATPLAVTAGPGWWIVVTEAGEVLVYDMAGRPVDRLSVTLPAGNGDGAGAGRSPAAP